MDRCNEEELRLKREHSALQSWMREEWSCIEISLEMQGMCVDVKVLHDTHAHFIEAGSSLCFQLEQRRDYLCRLCAEWQSKLIDVPCLYDLALDWGPSENLIQI